MAPGAEALTASGAGTEMQIPSYVIDLIKSENQEVSFQSTMLYQCAGDSDAG